MTRVLTGFLSLLLSLPLPAQNAVEKKRYDSSRYAAGIRRDDLVVQRLSFEIGQVLPSMSGSGYRLSEKHFKDGRSSLLWQWSDPAELAFDDLQGMEKAIVGYEGGQPETYEPSYVPPSRQGGMKLWIYRETAHPTGELLFSIGGDPAAARQNPRYRFRMRQNFTGWRAIWVHFEEDARVTGYRGDETMKTLLVSASADMRNDRVYFDLLQFLTYVSKKRHSDWQFIHRKDRARVDQYKVLPAWRKLQRFNREAAGLELDQRQQRQIAGDFARILQRYERLLLGPPGFDPLQARQGGEFVDFWQRQMLAAGEQMAQLDIRRQGRVITGLPLFSSRDEHPAEQRQTFQIASQKSFSLLALDYRLQPTGEKKRRLLDALAYFADQGWAAGSAVGTVDHFIRINPYAISVFLLRDALREAGDLESHRQALDWYTRFGDLADLDTSVGENSDLIRGGAVPKLLAVLLLKDSPEKFARMQALQRYLIHVAGFAPGYMDTVKPDYSIFHHLGAYQNTYGIQAVTTLALIHYLFEGTQFELPRNSVQHLKNTLMAQFDMAADFQLHPAMSGRFPYRNSGIDRYLLPAYAFMAMAGDRVVDKQMGAAFAWAYRRADLSLIHESLVPTLNYYGSLGTLALMESAWRQTQQLNWQPPAGHFSFPYAAASVHKRQGWAAAVRGWSQYVWDWESGAKRENPYGRYMAFGSLLLFTAGEPLSLEASGMDLDGGFHWSYAPGATTKALPMEKMAYFIKPTPGYPEGRHRNFTFNTFVGGLSHRGDNGLFAMRMHDTVKADEKGLFDDSFRADKTFFFFDNEIVALGSGISNSDIEHNTITTLFQSKLTEGGEPVWVGGKPVVREMSFRQRRRGGWLRDPQGNYYVVHRGQWILEQSQQASLVPDKPFSKKGKPVNQRSVVAPHVKAWLDHGKAPQKTGYEYQILVQGSEAAARRQLRHKNYRVLSRNADAHIVEHLTKGQIAYAVFNPRQNLPGPVTAVDSPLLLMSSLTENRLQLSVADPDLRLAKHGHNMSHMPIPLRKQVSAAKVAHIRVLGQWQLAEAHPDVVSIRAMAGETRIQLRLDHGLTRDLPLEAYSLSP